MTIFSFAKIKCPLAILILSSSLGCASSPSTDMNSTRDRNPATRSASSGSSKPALIQSDAHRISAQVKGTEDPYDAFRFHTNGRVVAIGDLHGDAQAMRNALKLAGAIDKKDRWIGGESHSSANVRSDRPRG